MPIAVPASNVKPTMATPFAFLEVDPASTLQGSVDSGNIWGGIHFISVGHIQPTQAGLAHITLDPSGFKQNRETME
jgi:hypothetical protein